MQKEEEVEEMEELEGEEVENEVRQSSRQGRQIAKGETKKQNKSGDSGKRVRDDRFYIARSRPRQETRTFGHE